MTATDCGDGTYVWPVPVDEVFADDSYQRPLDVARAQAMAERFDRRLIGIIEVSDRGDHRQPRYAVIEGQHRLAAVALRDPHGLIAARIHTGLSVAEEARLFHDIDTQRRRLSTWDRWKARRAQRDPVVLAVEDTVARVGLRVDNTPQDGHVRCTSTLEKISRTGGGPALLRDSLRLLHETWGKQQAAYDTAVVAGMALFLTEFGDREEFECDRLVDALIDLTPAKVGYFARAKKDNGAHGGGPLAKFVALTFVERYNLFGPPTCRLSAPRRFPGALRAADPAASTPQAA